MGFISAVSSTVHFTSQIRGVVARNPLTCAVTLLGITASAWRVENKKNRLCQYPYPLSPDSKKALIGAIEAVRYELHVDSAKCFVSSWLESKPIGSADNEVNDLDKKRARAFNAVLVHSIKFYIGIDNRYLDCEGQSVKGDLDVIQADLVKDLASATGNVLPAPTKEEFDLAVQWVRVQRPVLKRRLSLAVLPLAVTCLALVGMGFTRVHPMPSIGVLR